MRFFVSRSIRANVRALPHLQMTCRAAPSQSIRRYALPDVSRPARHRATRYRLFPAIERTSAACASPLLRKARPGFARLVPFPQDPASQECAARGLVPRARSSLRATTPPPWVNSVETVPLRTEAPPAIALTVKKSQSLDAPP